MTSLRNTQGCLYLPVCLDLGARKVIVWATSTDIVAESALMVLREAAVHAHGSRQFAVAAIIET